MLETTTRSSLNTQDPSVRRLFERPLAHWVYVAWRLIPYLKKYSLIGSDIVEGARNQLDQSYKRLSKKSLDTDALHDFLRQDAPFVAFIFTIAAEAQTRFAASAGIERDPAGSLTQSAKEWHAVAEGMRLFVRHTAYATKTELGKIARLFPNENDTA